MRQNGFQRPFLEYYPRYILEVSSSVEAKILSLGTSIRSLVSDLPPWITSIVLDGRNLLHIKILTLAFPNCLAILKNLFSIWKISVLSVNVSGVNEWMCGIAERFSSRVMARISGSGSILDLHLGLAIDNEMELQTQNEALNRSASTIHTNTWSEWFFSYSLWIWPRCFLPGDIGLLPQGLLPFFQLTVLSRLNFCFIGPSCSNLLS